MAGKRLRISGIILPIVLFTRMAMAQDTIIVQWYADTRPEVWLLHNNITAFAATADRKLPVPSDSDIVSRVEFAKSGRHLLVVYFKPHASRASKSSYIENLKRQGLQKQLLALSKPGAEAGSPFSRLLFIDDQVLVTFKADVSTSYVEAFAEKYNLQLVSQPETVFKDGSVFVFRYQRFTESDNSATLSSKIFEQEKDKVLAVHPNRVNLFEPQSTSDTYIDLARDVANNGQQVTCSSLQGSHEADAHIAGAWNLGYTGDGIKVGVIDFFGFDYNHPDMQGQMLPGWDCINNTDYNASNFYFVDATQAHGMAVCGVIAANGNNGTGAAGVAYGARVVPFLIDGSEASVVLAMQKARSSQFDVDIVNCSFGSYFPSPAIEAEIKNLVNLGRVRNGTIYGVTVVTSHGNDNYSDIEHPQYPSAYDEVISVGASTPDDKRKTPGDQWNTAGAWGSNYGAMLDIAAPGVCIFTTDLSGANGYSTGDYVAFQKTSASAPIVSGVAALALSKYPELNWRDLRTLLRSTADKTNNASEGGGYNYNYNPAKPGLSMEMGYGRINAEKAVADAEVETTDETTQAISSHLIISSLASHWLDIRYTLDEVHRAYQMTIFDIKGKRLLDMALPGGHGVISVDISFLQPGMYVVKCWGDNEIISNGKFVKIW